MENNHLEKYVFNNYRVKKLKDNFLITTNHGSYVHLSKEDFKKMTTKNLDNKLFHLLENNGVILTKNNEKRVISEYRLKNSFMYQGAALHIMIMSLRCNQSCIYCQASRKAENAGDYDMSEETAKKTVDFIFQSPSKAITIEFQGGEPLLNWPVIKFVIEYANKLNKTHKKNLRYNLVTNFILLTDDKLDYLFEKEIGICTSLDGPKELHDHNRKYHKGSSYDLVVKNLKKILSMNKPGADYHCKPNGLPTITRKSLPYCTEIIDEYVKNKFEYIWFRAISELGCAQTTWKELGYDAEEFLAFYKKGLKYIIDNKLPIRERLTMIILKKIMNKVDPNFLDLRSPCGAGIGQMAYQHNGDIYSCDEGRMVSDFFKLGTVDQKYNEVLTSKETCSLIASSVNDTLLCDQCVYKPYCGICPVCNYASKGNLIPKLAMDQRCKIFKGIFDHVFDKLLYDPKYSKVFKVWAEDDLIK